MSSSHRPTMLIYSVLVRNKIWNDHFNQYLLLIDVKEMFYLNFLQTQCDWDSAFRYVQITNRIKL